MLEGETVILAVTSLKKDANGARLIDFEGDVHWVPKSQSQLMMKPGTQDIEKIEIPLWLAKKLFPDEYK